MFYQRFEESIRENDFIAASIESGQWDRVIDYVNREVFDKPEEAKLIPALKQFFKAYATDSQVRGA